jgi:hypothetical protein
MILLDPNQILTLEASPFERFTCRENRISGYKGFIAYFTRHYSHLEPRQRLHIINEYNINNYQNNNNYSPRDSHIRTSKIIGRIIWTQLPSQIKNTWNQRADFLNSHFTSYGMIQQLPSFIQDDPQQLIINKLNKKVIDTHKSISSLLRKKKHEVEKTTRITYDGETFPLGFQSKTN